MSRMTDFGSGWYSAIHGRALAIGLVGDLDQVGQRLRIVDVLQQRHPVLVLDAVGLHRGDRLAAGLEPLRGQHRPRALQGRLDQRDGIQRIGIGLLIEDVQRGQRQRRQRLVEGEIELQIHGEPVPAAGLVGFVEPFDDARRRSAPCRSRWPATHVAAAGCAARGCPRSACASRSNALPGRDTTPSTMACDTRKCDVSGSGCAATSLSKVVSDQLTNPSGGLRRTTFRFLAASSPALATARSFSMTCSGREHHDVTGDVETGPAGPAGDLVELPGGQDPGAVAVVLGQRRHQHRPDRHVDPDPEGVRPADHLEQARTGPASRPAAGTWAASRRGAPRCRAGPAGTASGRSPGENRKSAITSAIWSRSARLATVRLDSACARSRADAWVKCTMYTGARLVASRSCRVSVSGTRVYEKCSGTGRSTFGDDGGLATGALGQVLGEELHVAERRRHQHELGPVQLQQRDLPGPAALRVAVVVELVHHHDAGVGVRTAAQRHPGQDLRRAADDRGRGVDRGIAGDHADRRRAEDVHQVEELLRHQRLDRRRVVRPAAGGQPGEQRRGGDQRSCRTRSACRR